MSADQELHENLAHLTASLARIEAAGAQRIAELEERLDNEVRWIQNDLHRLQKELRARLVGIAVPREQGEAIDTLRATVAELRAEVEGIADDDRDRANRLGAEVRRLQEQVDGLVAEVEAIS